jgi:peptidoglycan/LPS O-acetylase OafA/YrhL
MFGRFNMKASSWSFLIAVLAALVGMAWGIVMAVSHDHAAMPAHAHLNLLGWVSLFLFGVYYRLHLQLDKTVMARVQVAAWVVGTILLTVGVGMLHTGRPAGEPFAGIGSIIVLADMLLFGWLVLRQERAMAAA